MNKLSIIELYPFSGWGAIANHVYDLSYGLSVLGHNVSVVTSDCEGVEKFSEVAKVYKLPLTNDRVDIKYVFYLAKMIGERKADIVHVHGGRNSWVALAAIWLAGRGKVVNTWHGLREPKKDPIHKWLYKQIGAIISVSDMLKRRILAVYPYINTNKIHVVHNGSDIHKFSKQQNNDIRAEFNTSKNQFIIACFARIHPEKGIEYAIKAMNLLDIMGKDVVLWIVGREDDIQYNNYLHELVKTLKLEQRVVFCGFTTNVADYMNVIDVLVAPSICKESFGLVLCEAMACSKPVITTALGAQEEIVQDRISGYIIPPFSEQAIAEKVKNLIHNRALCNEFGKQGYKIVKQKFTRKVMGEKTADVFYSCISIKRMVNNES